MTSRLLLPVLGAFVLGCTEMPDASVLAPDDVRYAAVTAAPEIVHSALPVQHAVYHPCTAEIVHVSGVFLVTTLSRALEEDRFELRYTAASTGVTAEAPDGHVGYQVAGAAVGVVTTSHRDRAVSTADYQILATAQPGVELGAAQVHARLSVAFAFPVAQDGTLQEPILEGLRVAKDCI